MKSHIVECWLYKKLKPRPGNCQHSNGRQIERKTFSSAKESTCTACTKRYGAVHSISHNPLLHKRNTGTWHQLKRSEGPAVHLVYSMELLKAVITKAQSNKVSIHQKKFDAVFFNVQYILQRDMHRKKQLSQRLFEKLYWIYLFFFGWSPFYRIPYLDKSLRKCPEISSCFR